MRFPRVLGALAVAAGIAALAYLVYTLISSALAMVVSLLVLMALGVSGDASALPFEVYRG